MVHLVNVTVVLDIDHSLRTGQEAGATSRRRGGDAHCQPEFGLDRTYLDKLSRALAGPMVALSWYGAATYCNWLSKREKLPESR